MDLKKIAILTEAGGEFGYGHITRCISLYRELRKRKLEVCFIINEDKEVLERFADINFRTYALNGDKYNILGHVRGADAVIIDSYRLNRDVYKKISSLVKLVVCIDDNARIRYPLGMVINGNIYAKELINYPRTNGIKYLLGAKYAPLRNEFRNVKSIKIKDRIKHILIIAGGNDFRNITGSVAAHLLSRFPGINLAVISGKGVQRINAKIRNKKASYRYLKCKDMVRLMLKSDIAISGGGQTLCELARLGIPTIGICIASNQTNNLKGWAKRGFLYYCGWYNNPLLFKKLDSALTRIQSMKARVLMSKIGSDAVDGKGSQRIVEKILEALN